MDSGTPKHPSLKFWYPPPLKIADLQLYRIQILFTTVWLEVDLQGYVAMVHPKSSNLINVNKGMKIDNYARDSSKEIFNQDVLISLIEIL